MDERAAREMIGLVFYNLKFMEFFARKKDDPYQNDTIGNFLDEWHCEIGINDYSLLNQAFVLLTLYGSIVFAQELFEKNIPTTDIDRLDKNNWGIPSDLSGVSESRYMKDRKEICDRELNRFVDRIRNSISHPKNLEIDDSLNFTFHDENTGNIRVPVFNVTFSIKELLLFIHSFNECIKNDRTGA